MQSKKSMIILTSIIVIAIIGIFIFSILSNKKNDSQNFHEAYPKVAKENVFIYKNEKDIIKILEHGTGLIYLGFPECPWCQSYVVYLNEIATQNGLEEISYLDILTIRKNNTKEYQQIVYLLKDYLRYDEEGNQRIYVPAVIAVKNGEIVGFNDETSYDTKGYQTPEEYWQKEDLVILKKKLTDMVQMINNNLCTDCNK